MTGSGLPQLLTARVPKPTGILTECTVMINLTRPLNLEFKYETFYMKDSITSPCRWSIRLKLIPIVLSFTFSRFNIVIPNMSLSLKFSNARRNKSNKQASKWLKGSVGSEVGRRWTTICVPVALKRRYCLLVVSSISNLRANIQQTKGICAVSH